METTKLRTISLLFCLAIACMSFAQEFGYAGYYSDKFIGKPTASGEKYDNKDFTAAHKSLPFGTIARVTRLDNNESVDVRIIDRGPYISGRVIDLSLASAKKLDFISDGMVKVKVEALSGAPEKEKEETFVAPAIASVDPIKTEQPAVTEKKVTIEQSSKPVKPKKEEAKKVETVKVVEKKPELKKVTPTTTEMIPMPGSFPYGLKTGAPYESTGLFAIQVARPNRKGFAVQIAALESFENALRQMTMMQEEGYNNALLLIETDKNVTRYKVLVGPFVERKDADSASKKVKKRLKLDGFVVDLEQD